jgi:hypothetical protein
MQFNSPKTQSKPSSSPFVLAKSPAPVSQMYSPVGKQAQSEKIALQKSLDEIKLNLQAVQAESSKFKKERDEYELTIKSLNEKVVALSNERDFIAEQAKLNDILSMPTQQFLPADVPKCVQSALAGPAPTTGTNATQKETSFASFFRPTGSTSNEFVLKPAEIVELRDYAAKVTKAYEMQSRQVLAYQMKQFDLFESITHYNFLTDSFEKFLVSIGHSDVVQKIKAQGEMKGCLGEVEEDESGLIQPLLISPDELAAVIAEEVQQHHSSEQDVLASSTSSHSVKSVILSPVASSAPSMFKWNHDAVVTTSPASSVGMAQSTPAKMMMEAEVEITESVDSTLYQGISIPIPSYAPSTNVETSNESGVDSYEIPAPVSASSSAIETVAELQRKYETEFSWRCKLQTQTSTLFAELTAVSRLFQEAINAASIAYEEREEAEMQLEAVQKVNDALTSDCMSLEHQLNKAYEEKDLLLSKLVSLSQLRTEWSYAQAHANRRIMLAEAQLSSLQQSMLHMTVQSDSIPSPGKSETATTSMTSTGSVPSSSSAAVVENVMNASTKERIQRLLQAKKRLRVRSQASGVTNLIPTPVRMQALHKRVMMDIEAPNKTKVFGNVEVKQQSWLEQPAPVVSEATAPAPVSEQTFEITADIDTIMAPPAPIAAAPATHAAANVPSSIPSTTYTPITAAPVPVNAYYPPRYNRPRSASTTSSKPSVAAPAPATTSAPRGASNNSYKLRGFSIPSRSRSNSTTMVEAHQDPIAVSAPVPAPVAAEEEKPQPQLLRRHSSIAKLITTISKSMSTSCMCVAIAASKGETKTCSSCDDALSMVTTSIYGNEKGHLHCSNCHNLFCGSCVKRENASLMEADQICSACSMDGLFTSEIL